MFFLAIRHLINRPQQTVLTFIGIIIGAAGYIVFAGIQIGYSDYVVDRMVNIDAYVRISPRESLITPDSFKDVFFPDTTVKWLTPPSGRLANTYLVNVKGWFERLDADPDVAAYAPQLLRDGILSHGKFSQTVRIYGINPVVQRHVTNIERDITRGKLTALGEGDSLIMIGEELMNLLGASYGTTINAVSSNGSIYPLKIVTQYKTGIKQIDCRIVYASIATVQKITQSPGEISDIAVRLKDVNRCTPVAAEWQRYSQDKVESWDQSKEDVRVTLKTQTIVRNSTSFTIILIVAFGIYNILNMVVNQKKREIAILRSIGYDQRETIFLFMVQGVILGIGGALFGILLGMVSCYYIEKIQIGTGLGHMPMSWDKAIYVKAVIIVVASSIIASFIPARNAGRLSPIDIIRNS